ncbi:hypothetical protein [Actinoplanes sp. NPDC049316]|uniref:hypothetical protein n=1 Tax=Actinoplanes sp. NPDC049316 TaxID=3154727 RepID=UPI003419267E
MAVVVRLLPRHWDGRRLLQFLTGLALIALAFATPALSAAPDADSPATVVTTVDAPVGTGLADRVVVPDARSAQGAGPGSATSAEEARAAAIAGLEARAAAYRDAPRAAAVAGLEARATASGDAPAASDAEHAVSGDAARTAVPPASWAEDTSAPFSTGAAGPARLCDRAVPGLSGAAPHPYAGRAPPRA